jgi:hypothetical protein
VIAAQSLPGVGRVCCARCFMRTHLTFQVKRKVLVSFLHRVVQVSVINTARGSITACIQNQTNQSTQDNRNLFMDAGQTSAENSILTDRQAKSSAGGHQASQ